MYGSNFEKVALNSRNLGGIVCWTYRIQNFYPSQSPAYSKAAENNNINIGVLAQ